MIKLGDFGLALILAPNEQASTSFYVKGKGTAGCLTPVSKTHHLHDYSNTGVGTRGDVEK